MMRQIQRRFLGPILACFLGLVVLGFTHTASGQAAVSGTLVGTVTDSSGAAVVGAQVTATVPATGISHVTTTNGSGNYAFPDMPPGNYSIKVTAQGFQTSVQANIDLLVDTSPRTDFKLQPGAVTQSVVVNSAPPVLQTDSADISSTIEQAAVEDLPLTSGRDFQSLLNLVPGATPAVFQHSQMQNAEDALQTEVNGMPYEFNHTLIEGVTDDETQDEVQLYIPPAAAIQSVQVTTDDYDASLGTAVGAVTNVTLKSGANQFHGSAYWYVQNNAADARSYFSGPLGHLSYNYVGGTIGGPIVKDKLFFFGDYLHSVDSEAASNTFTIPDARWYTNAGVTSGCTDPTGCVDLSAALVTTGSGPTAGQIYDPATGDGNSTPRTPFTNNQIPYSRINPITVTMLMDLDAAAAKYGKLNSTEPLSAPVNNYTANIPLGKTANTYDGKLDYTPNSSNHLSFRYSYQDFGVLQAPAFGPFLGGPAAGGFEGTSTQPTFSTGVTYNHVFSPNLITVLRLGIAHMHSNAHNSDYGSNDATALGIPGGNISGLPFSTGQVTIGLGDDFSNSGNPMIGYNANIPWEEGDLNVDAVNGWTKIIGNHTITWGGEVQRVHYDILQLGYSPRGEYDFTDLMTSNNGASDNDANDMASWLLDQPADANQGVYSDITTLRDWWFAAYVGDKWQATPKMTVDLGLRWEDYRAITPNRAGGAANYNYTNNTLEVAGYGNVPLNLGARNDFHYFGPRTGIAYRVNSSTVIRAGAGISYVPDVGFPQFNNYPVDSLTDFLPTGTSPFTPAVLADGVTEASFQEGFPAPTYPVVPPSGIIPVTGLLLNDQFNSLALNSRAPMAYGYNLAVERTFGANYSLDVAYVGDHVSRMENDPIINYPSTYGGGTASEPELIEFGMTGQTTVFSLPSTNNYNSLQVKFTKRFSSGFSTYTAFTWGKALNYTTGDIGSLHFFVDPRRNYGPADYNNYRNFEQTFVYALPAGSGHRYFNSHLGDAFLGDWRLTGMISLVSGKPFTVLADAGALNTPGTDLTANLTGKLQIMHGIGRGNLWFNKSQFSQPSGCTTTPCTNPGLGNTGRNQFTGPGYIQDNFSLAKDFATYHELKTELRVDAFQLSNTPQFGVPSSSLTSSSFGKVTSTVHSGVGAVNGIGGGRVLQAAVTFTF